MSIQLIIVFTLNFIIALIGTLAYSVRLVGIRTGKIAITFALFNILSIVTRTAAAFQLPFLTKYMEVSSRSDSLYRTFISIILISGMATIVGAFLIPTFQRALTKGVLVFSIEKSLPKLMIHSLSKTGIKHFRECVTIPSKENVTKLNVRHLPKKVIVYNLLAVAIITVGSLAPLYAGTMQPELRATCITLASVINGFAAILMTIFIDPQLSIMTDDVIEQKCSEEEFRTCVIGMVCSKTVGTFLALFILMPASYLIVFIARII